MIIKLRLARCDLYTAKHMSTALGISYEVKSGSTPAHKNHPVHVSRLDHKLIFCNLSRPTNQDHKVQCGIYTILSCSKLY